MANMRSGDRAQLFLVTALVLAIAMIAFIMLFNAAIYTQNISSRNLGADDRAALSEASTAIGGSRMLLIQENREGHSDHGSLKDAYFAGMTDLDIMQRSHELTRGTYVAVHNVSASNGYSLQQDGTRTFTNNVSTTDWSVATDAENVRKFEMTIEDVDTSTDPVNDSFRLEITGDGSNTWEMYAFDENGTLTISTRVNGGSLTDCCPSNYSSTPVHVNLTQRTINGAPCNDLNYSSTVTRPYDISISRGNTSKGTYQLVVNTTQTNGFNSDGTDPYQYPVLYSSRGNFTYQSPDLYYHKSFRIAPGEPNA